MARMSSMEFQTWKVLYYKLMPFGEQRDDIRSGMAFSALINTIKQAWFKDPAMTKPSDFILDLFRVPEVQSQKDIKAVFKAMADGYKMKEARRKARLAKQPALKPKPSLPIRGGNRGLR